MRIIGIMVGLATAMCHATATSVEQPRLQSSFELCESGFGSQESLISSATANEMARGICISQKREAINAALSQSFKNSICTAASQGSYSRYKRSVDGVKQRVGDPVFAALSYSQIAFYVNCKDGQNPLYLSMESVKLAGDSEGLAQATTEFVQGMGALLLEEGPDGRTALDHVQFLLNAAIANANAAHQAIYGKIKTDIEAEIQNLQEKTVAPAPLTSSVEGHLAYQGIVEDPSSRSGSKGIYGDNSLQHVNTTEQLNNKAGYLHGRLRMYFDRNKPNSGSVCTATPISERFVVTSGHCVYEESEKIWPFQVVFQPSATYGFKPQNLFAKKIYLLKAYKHAVDNSQPLSIEAASQDLAIVEFDRTHWQDNVTMPYGFRNYYFAADESLVASPRRLMNISGYVWGYPQNPKRGYLKRMLWREGSCQIQFYNRGLYVSTCDSIGGISGSAFMGKLPSGQYPEHDFVLAVTSGTRDMSMDDDKSWAEMENRFPGNITNLKRPNADVQNVVTRINRERYFAIRAIIEGGASDLFVSKNMSRDTFGSLDFLNPCRVPIQLKFKYTNKLGQLDDHTVRLDSAGTREQMASDALEFTGTSYLMSQINLEQRKELYHDEPFVSKKGGNFTGKRFPVPTEDSIIKIRCS